MSASELEARGGLGGRAWTLVGDSYGPGAGEQTLEVTDPATGAPIGEVALADTAAIDRAVAAASAAAPGWAATPATKRSRLLIQLARALEDEADLIAPLITRDNGKTLTDARAEIARSVEHLEAAASAPALLAGEVVIDVLPGLDSQLVREPLGVSAIVAPFNFPIMTGLIYWAWALACGNAIVIKPSEQAPFTASALGALVRRVGFPAGVVNIVHGGREAVEALCDHPGIASLSLVGSSPVAEIVYARASASGKRVQTAGGARNPLVVMPDADLDVAAQQIVTAAYTMAGQRCLSTSIVVAVGGTREELVRLIAEKAAVLTTGAGSDPATDVGPLISAGAVEKLGQAVDAAIAAGAELVLDGRGLDTTGYLVAPTLLDGVPADSPLLGEESFGPLVSVVEAADIEDALAVVNGSPFGNAASIFTASAATARRFRTAADVGNIGVNVGVAAPTAHVGFGGRRQSFRGTIHSQGRTAVEFFTDLKSVSERWV